MPSCQQQKDQKNNVSDSKKGIKSLSQDHQKSAKLCQQQKDRKTWLKGRSTIIVTWFKQKKLFLNQQQKGQKNLEGHKTMWLSPKRHEIIITRSSRLRPSSLFPSCSILPLSDDRCSHDGVVQTFLFFGDRCSHVAVILAFLIVDYDPTSNNCLRTNK